MKFLGKRGMEIAAGTIIMLIVSIVVLGLALTLTYNVFCAAEDTARDISSQNRDQINRLLTSGGRVVVPDNNREARVEGSFICGSSRSQAVDFAIGIQNRGQTQGGFNVQVNFEGATDNSGGEIDTAGLFGDNHLLISIGDQDPSSGVTSIDISNLNIPNGQTVMGTLIVNLPLNAPQGQYQYSIRVIQGGQLYGAQMAYVSVR